jgi:hypothetical protein
MYILRLVGLVPKLAICVTVTAKDGMVDNAKTQAEKMEFFNEQILPSFFMISAPLTILNVERLWNIRFCRRIIYAFSVDNYPYRTLSTLWVS